MSSAALPAAAHQPTTVASPSSGTASRQQYVSGHSSPTQESYHAHHSSATSPSRRPPSRGRGAATQAHHSTSTSSSLSRTLPSTLTPQGQSAPVFDRITTMPPVAPPRSSSNQQQSSSRRAYSGERKNAEPPRHAQSDSSKVPHSSGSNGATEGPRSKRAVTAQAASETTPSRSREARVPEAMIQQAGPKTTHDPRETFDRSLSNPDDATGRAGHQQYHDEAAPPPVVGTGEERRGGRSRQEHKSSHKSTSKFGNFILGNTIGEGEFGKVKLGWKQDSNVQVAIKLIKRDSVGGNPSRLTKIQREVTILRGVQHPNIVRLFDMVETDRYIGIILEYASGGELFDYILNHRYLKDHSARRLFSQLVSGVGYLHKKGIVHRDLKLENLLLDRHRNIIITDFGFANTFDPNEDLTDEEEMNLADKDFVKRAGLDKLKPNGMRRGDLMQTSCGSPCYAAPELVVSDSLYTGRKVDVWSCGVILYAMLAGYLPFDDDPANPEGDNINLLYKYIVTTPLTFPEYVTPHARDLLRRILVPNPRKRADLFEVARHSWLSEYAHVVEFITSQTTLPSDVRDTPATRVEDYQEATGLGRSSSVRETTKPKSPTGAPFGGLGKAQLKIDQPQAEPRTTKDAKRRTVQVEYVAPTTQTQRGAELMAQAQGQAGSRRREAQEKPLPQDPPASRGEHTRRPPVSAHNSSHARISYEGREAAYTTRPRTGGSMQSSHSLGLQNYGQPAPPEVAGTNALGSIQQPDDEPIGRPSVGVSPKFAQMTGIQGGQRHGSEGKGHKRSNTIGEISAKFLGRNGSMFGRSKKRIETEKANRKYPPVSMTNALPAEEPAGGRSSIDSKHSRRSFSLGLGKKPSGSMSGSQGSGEKQDRRRFSLLPASFSLKAIGLGKGEDSNPPSDVGSQASLPIQDNRFDQQRSVTAHGDARGGAFMDNLPQRPANSGPARHQRYASAQLDNRRTNAIPPHLQNATWLNSGSDPSVDRRPPTEPQLGLYSQNAAESEGWDGQRIGSSRGNRAVLQKPHKRFTDGYENDQYRGHEGSSGAAKRVMDFFRRRGKARGGE